MSPGPLFYPKVCTAEFRCPACGQLTPCEFHDPAAFDEDEPIVGRNEWAQRAALETAQGKLDKAAQRAIVLCRCPRCGVADPLAARRAYLRAALPLIGFAPASFMVGVILISMLFPAARSAPLVPLLGALLLSLGLSALVVVRGQRRLIHEAQQSVRFLLPAPERKDPAP